MLCVEFSGFEWCRSTDPVESVVIWLIGLSSPHRRDRLRVVDSREPKSVKVSSRNPKFGGGLTFPEPAKISDVSSSDWYSSIADSLEPSATLAWPRHFGVRTGLPPKSHRRNSLKSGLRLPNLKTYLAELRIAAYRPQSYSGYDSLQTILRFANRWHTRCTSAGRLT